MKPKIYIDGKDGTTGLQIYDRLAARSDIDLLLIDEAKRKDNAERAKLMNAADIVFLCLPDAAAIEAVTLVTNPGTRIIDASTAHRTAEGWTYGYPELSKTQREAIRTAKRVANPGCHATGFISTVAPMVRMGIIPAEMCLLPYRLLRRREKAHRRVRGRSPGPPARLPPHLRYELAAQAPAGDDKGLRPDPCPGVQPHFGGFLQRHGDYGHAA